jgi:5-carboxymethyl-2-hydroxymuconate isomerase
VPHLTLEYTRNLTEKAPPPDLFLQVHRLLASAAGIRAGNCKSRWLETENWVVGDGEGESAFVHLSIRFLEGRPLETRQDVGAGALEILRSHFLPAPKGVDLQITVEVREIQEALYFKDPAGTLTPPGTG